tara:strand:+ start:221 stop:469 length:249 start_codon:yes stop_codon:yes gene_type:complete
LFVPIAENCNVIPLAASAKEMTTIARKLFAVNLGKSGVNFAVAETGIFNLEENEGNDRFSTTLSPVHVAVMGNFDFTSFNNY